MFSGCFVFETRVKMYSYTCGAIKAQKPLQCHVQIMTFRGHLPGSIRRSLSRSRLLSTPDARNIMTTRTDHTQLRGLAGVDVAQACCSESSSLLHVDNLCLQVRCCHESVDSLSRCRIGGCHNVSRCMYHLSPLLYNLLSKRCMKAAVILAAVQTTETWRTSPVTDPGTGTHREVYAIRSICAKLYQGG